MDAPKIRDIMESLVLQNKGVHKKNICTIVDIHELIRLSALVTAGQSLEPFVTQKKNRSKAAKLVLAII